MSKLRLGLSSDLRSVSSDQSRSSVSMQPSQNRDTTNMHHMEETAHLLAKAALVACTAGRAHSCHGRTDATARGS